MLDTAYRKDWAQSSPAHEDKEESSSEESALPGLVWAHWGVPWLISSSACECKLGVLSDFCGAVNQKEHIWRAKS